jgi:hypothetical protein
MSMQDLIGNSSFTRIETKTRIKILVQILRGIVHVEQLGKMARKY